GGGGRRGSEPGVEARPVAVGRAVLVRVDERAERAAIDVVGGSPEERIPRERRRAGQAEVPDLSREGRQEIGRGDVVAARGVRSEHDRLSVQIETVLKAIGPSHRGGLAELEVLVAWL